MPINLEIVTLICQATEVKFGNWMVSQSASNMVWAFVWDQVRCLLALPWSCCILRAAECKKLQGHFSHHNSWVYNSHQSETFWFAIGIWNWFCPSFRKAMGIIVPAVWCSCLHVAWGVLFNFDIFVKVSSTWSEQITVIILTPSEDFSDFSEFLGAPFPQILFRQHT